MSQVSWIRRRDSHILTIDWLLFIADDRFRIFLVEPTCTWTLQIKYVQPRDAGIYECQINTSPKMSHLVQLNVVGKYCIHRSVENEKSYKMYYDMHMSTNQTKRQGRWKINYLRKKNVSQDDYYYDSVLVLSYILTFQHIGA